MGYDDTTNQLEIEYRSGDVYRYSMVPPSLHRALMSAESIGAFLAREITPHYPVREVHES